MKRKEFDKLTGSLLPFLKIVFLVFWSLLTGFIVARFLTITVSESLYPRLPLDRIAWLIATGFMLLLSGYALWITYRMYGGVVALVKRESKPVFRIAVATVVAVAIFCFLKIFGGY